MARRHALPLAACLLALAAAGAGAARSLQQQAAGTCPLPQAAIDQLNFASVSQPCGTSHESLAGGSCWRGVVPWLRRRLPPTTIHHPATPLQLPTPTGTPSAARASAPWATPS